MDSSIDLRKGHTGRLSSTEVLGQDGDGTDPGRLSSRRYPVGLEPVGQKVERVPRSTSKSAVSRRVVAATETTLAELHAAPLDGLAVAYLMSSS